VQGHYIRPRRLGANIPDPIAFVEDVRVISGAAKLRARCQSVIADDEPTWRLFTPDPKAFWAVGEGDAFAMR
jgi:hypothetical protein